MTTPPIPFPEASSEEIIPKTYGKTSFSKFSSQELAHKGLKGPRGSKKTPANTNFTSNKWWSSLGWNFDNASPHSLPMFPHPFAPVQAQADGLRLAYSRTWEVTGNRAAFFSASSTASSDIVAGIAGMNSPETKVEGFSDWAVSGVWNDGTRTLRATLGKGFPFVYFTSSGGSPQISLLPLAGQTPTIWYNQKGVLGLTLNNNSYGIFAPQGLKWVPSVDGSHFQLNTAQDSFFSVALLPNEAATDVETQKNILEYYRKHAYAFITDTQVRWAYDESTSNLKTQFSVKTKQMDSQDASLSTTPLLALYPHQWKNSPNITSIPTAYTYTSSRGKQMVIASSWFQTEVAFHGVLPSLLLPNPSANLTAPAAAALPVPTLIETPMPKFKPMPELSPIQSPSGLPDFFYNDMLELINAPNFGGDTYFSGLRIAKYAHLIPIAHELNLTTHKEALLKIVKAQLIYWFNSSKNPAPSFSFNYLSDWSTLIGYPSGFGSDEELNDHHFHWGYFMMSAAIVSLFDKDWVSDSQYGSMVKMLIRDAGNPLHNDPMFPFFRNFDPYEGHSWASGHAHFTGGNNQESSSEAVNFATAILLFGETTGNKTLRDLGIYLYTTEVSATEQYWFNVDQVKTGLPPQHYSNFPSSSEFPHPALGIIWGAKCEYSTWFSAAPEAIHGINFLPFHGGSLYLGYHPEYMDLNYSGFIAAKNGALEDLHYWSDLMWQAQVFGKLGRSGTGTGFSVNSSALTKFETNKLNYHPEEGETKTHTYHWIASLTGLGNVDASLVSNSVTASVFKDPASNAKTYLAYNSQCTARNVKFSDGTTFSVPPRTFQAVRNSSLIKSVQYPSADCN